MEPNCYKLIFSLIIKNTISFTVVNKREEVSVIYNKDNDKFTYNNQNELSKIINDNKLQLKKILHSALKGKQITNHPIHFGFIKGFPFINSHDFNHYIQVDRRNNGLDIQVRKKETNNIYKIFADGSYSKNEEQSGFAGIIEDEKGNQQVFQECLPVKSSNLIELLAVTEGLKRLIHIDKIQVNTDSRYVIRGLIQWVHFWKLNNWHTAQGNKVKYASHWQQIDKLSDNKLIELKWIKGHSGDVNHSYCHQMAKQLATNKD